MTVIDRPHVESLPNYFVPDASNVKVPAPSCLYWCKACKKTSFWSETFAIFHRAEFVQEVRMCKLFSGDRPLEAKPGTAINTGCQKSNKTKPRYYATLLQLEGV